ncbi:hypothetical protein AAXE64_07955 [Priestia megaterium]
MSILYFEFELDNGSTLRDVYFTKYEKPVLTMGKSILRYATSHVQCKHKNGEDVAEKVFDASIKKAYMIENDKEVDMTDRFFEIVEKFETKGNHRYNMNIFSPLVSEVIYLESQI